MSSNQNIGFVDIELIESVFGSDAKTTQEALLSGFDPNTQYNGKHVIHWLLLESNYKSERERKLELLLEAGADPSLKSMDTVLGHVLCCWRRYDAYSLLRYVELLLEFGTRTHSVNNNFIISDGCL